MILRRLGKAPMMMALSLAVCGLFVPAWAGDRRDSAVAATDYGPAIGHIYDAVTGLPIQGARVVVQEQGVFAEQGRTVSTTDARGRYECQASMGRVSTKYNAGSILGEALGVGGLFGPMSTTTRRIDATQLNFRVTEDGYRAFEGVVRCRMADAGRFVAMMEPVLLTPADSEEVSTAADGWGVLRLLEVRVEPEVAHPRDKVKVTAWAGAPAVAAAKERGPFLEALFGGGSRSQPEVAMASPLWRGEKALAYVGEDDKGLRFEAEVGLPRSVAGTSFYVSVAIRGSPLEIVSGGRLKRAPLQVIPREADARAAELRLAAEKLSQQAENTQALAKLQELCALPEATPEDLLQLDITAESVHDYPTAIDALQRALKLVTVDKRPLVTAGQQVEPDSARWLMLMWYASVLWESGQAERVIAEVAPEVEKVPEKERLQRVPEWLMVALGNSYLDLARLSEAGKIRDTLARQEGGATTDEARAFRRRLRLASCEKTVADDPNRAQAWADWGRALVDEGRWEEAVVKLQTALQKDPGMSVVQRDLAYASMHLQREQVAVDEQLDQAIAAAEKQATGGQSGAESRSFYDWHALAMLLHRKACQLRAAADPAQAATLEKTTWALTQAVKYGRAGAEVSDYGGYSDGGLYAVRDILIEGFAYPEAGRDYLVLVSLDAATRDPEDYLAWFTSAAALLDLAQPDLAQPALEECVKLRPDFTEAKYAQAVLARQQGRSGESMALLQQLLKLNPRHPFAYQKLAELYAEDADLVNAAACLVAHAAVYGEAR